LTRWVLAVLVASCTALASADSDDLLRRTGNLLDKHAITTGQFIQTATVAALNAPLISGGVFYFDRDQGVSWHVDRPISARFIFRPTATDTRVASAPTMPMAWIGQMLNAVLAGDFTQLIRQFSIDGSVSTEHWALSLTPKSAAFGRAIAKIEIEGAAAVSRIKVFEANGDDVSIAFSVIEYPDSLPADVEREFEQAH